MCRTILSNIRNHNLAIYYRTCTWSYIEEFWNHCFNYPTYNVHYFLCVINWGGYMMRFTTCNYAPRFLIDTAQNTQIRFDQQWQQSIQTL